ncbi:MAG: translesion error-prone DNA polymerase V autoproteolytic subunit [Cyanobacteria bacterium REEB417]|nr:translesion error-prone DNA polymerase V autoproteolytic subunit [Cyanobacteria bacterium REEB417]
MRTSVPVRKAAVGFGADLVPLGEPCPGGVAWLLPLALEAVAAGFPSPAADYVDASIDLNVELVPHPSATFFLRVEGDAMAAAGICHGDLLVVDRSVTPRGGSTVVVAHGGQLLLRRLEGRAPRWRLVASDPAVAPLVLSGDDPHLLIWGVVRHAVHHLLPGHRPRHHQKP